MANLIEVRDVRFTVARDKPNTVRAMHNDIYKAFIRTSDSWVWVHPVIEFTAVTTQQAKEQYVQQIESGDLKVVDDGFS